LSGLDCQQITSTLLVFFALKPVFLKTLGGTMQKNKLGIECGFGIGKFEKFELKKPRKPVVILIYNIGNLANFFDFQSLSSWFFLPTSKLSDLTSFRILPVIKLDRKS
jgi:hypothetical protein